MKKQHVDFFLNLFILVVKHGSLRTKENATREGAVQLCTWASYKQVIGAQKRNI